ncbi:MAG: hypothetical protein JOZ78_13470 [Chroococcidiopsidaceae cyanobacterium CP_BM_ER_R8_30]|nr:hypothetical protein [Chroococcidiopsidaceae cyanobacterium CP_BM_ER_R8_30]
MVAAGDRIFLSPAEYLDWEPLQEFFYPDVLVTCDAADIDFTFPASLLYEDVRLSADNRLRT